MACQPGGRWLDKQMNYNFLGACTKGRIETFRAFASLVKGHKKGDLMIWPKK